MEAEGVCDCPPCPPGCPPCESPCPCGGGEPVAAPEGTSVPNAVGISASVRGVDSLRRGNAQPPSFLSAEPWHFEVGTIVPGLQIPSLRRRGSRQGRGDFDSPGEFGSGSAAMAGRVLQPRTATAGAAPEDLSDEDRDLARRSEAAKRMQEAQGPSLAKRDLPGGPKEAPASARAAQDRLRPTERGAGPAAAGSDESLAAARESLSDRRYEPYQPGASRESENALSAFRDRAQERGKDAVVASSRGASDAYAPSAASRMRTAAEAMKAQPQSTPEATAPSDRVLSEAAEERPSPLAAAPSPQVFGLEDTTVQASPSSFELGESQSQHTPPATPRRGVRETTRGANITAQPREAARDAVLRERGAVVARRTSDDPLRPEDDVLPRPALHFVPTLREREDDDGPWEVLEAPATTLVAGSDSATLMPGGGSARGADGDVRPDDGGRAVAAQAKSLEAAFQERISGNLRAPGKVDPRLGEIFLATHALDVAVRSFLATIPDDKRLSELVFTRLTGGAAFRALVHKWATTLDEATKDRRPAEAEAIRRAAIRAFGDQLYAQELDRWKKSGRKPPKPKRKDAHARAGRLLGEAQSPKDPPPPPVNCPCPCAPAAGGGDGAGPNDDGDGGDEDDGSGGGRGTLRSLGGALPGEDEVRAVGSWVSNPSSSGGAARPPETPPPRVSFVGPGWTSTRQHLTAGSQGAGPPGGARGSVGSDTAVGNVSPASPPPPLSPTPASSEDAERTAAEAAEAAEFEKLLRELFDVVLADLLKLVGMEGMEIPVGLREQLFAKLRPYLMEKLVRLGTLGAASAALAALPDDISLHDLDLAILDLGDAVLDVQLIDAEMYVVAFGLMKTTADAIRFSIDRGSRVAPEAVAFARMFSRNATSGRRTLGRHVVGLAQEGLRLEREQDRIQGADFGERFHRRMQRMRWHSAVAGVLRYEISRRRSYDGAAREAMEAYEEATAPPGLIDTWMKEIDDEIRKHGAFNCWAKWTARAVVEVGAIAVGVGAAAHAARIAYRGAKAIAWARTALRGAAVAGATELGADLMRQGLDTDREGVSVSRAAGAALLAGIGTLVLSGIVSAGTAGLRAMSRTEIVARVRSIAGIRGGEAGVPAAERVRKFFNLFPDSADPSRRAELMARYVAKGKSLEEARALAAPLTKRAMGEHWISRERIDDLLSAAMERRQYRVASALAKFRDSRFNVLKPRGISRGEFEELHYLVDPARYGGSFGPRNAFRYSGATEGLTKYGSLGQAWYGTPNATKVVIGGTVVVVGGGTFVVRSSGD